MELPIVEVLKSIGSALMVPIAALLGKNAYTHRQIQARLKKIEEAHNVLTVKQAVTDSNVAEIKKDIDQCNRKLDKIIDRLWEMNNETLKRH